MVGLNGLMAYAFVTQVVGGEPFGNKPMSDTGLMLSMALTVAVSYFLLNLRLDTRVDAQGIEVRFFPIHIQFRRFDWGQLAKCYLRQYSPLREYGGWGIRVGLFGKGKAYNISGNQGLQLEFANGKKLLIGTNRAKEMEDTLAKIGAIK